MHIWSQIVVSCYVQKHCNLYIECKNSIPVSTLVIYQYFRETGLLAGRKKSWGLFLECPGSFSGPETVSEIFFISK